MEGIACMEKEIERKRQEVSARDGPIDDFREIENKQNGSDESYETSGEDDVDETVFLEAEIKIVGANETKEEAKIESDFAPLALV